MPSSPSLRVARALRVAPCSVAKLARTAGVSPTLLTLIRRGHRRATPDTLARLAGALEQWSRDCAQAARLLRGSSRTPSPMRHP